MELKPSDINNGAVGLPVASQSSPAHTGASPMPKPLPMFCQP